MGLFTIRESEECEIASGCRHWELLILLSPELICGLSLLNWVNSSPEPQQGHLELPGPNTPPEPARHYIL